jgi:hypothetical protein
VTCYLLTRRIICGLRIFYLDLLDLHRRSLQSLITLRITSHEPATSSGSSSAPCWRKPLLRIFRDELLVMTIPDCCDNQPLPAYLISAIHCWSVRCQDICISTNRCLVVTITPLFRLPMLPCLQNCLEHFSCIRGYIILSVAWQWVFLALGNSAFQTTCHNILLPLIWDFPSGTGFIWNSLYNLRTDHTESISPGCYCWNVCTNHCTATVAVLTIAKPLLLRYPAKSSKHSYFYCCLCYNVFTESLPSNALAIYVTI